MPPRRKPIATTPRRRPRQERAQVTRDAMLIAVERVLARHGVAGLTTNHVAEIGGVSIGSVYQYFPNKQALVAALIERNLAQFEASFHQVLEAERDTPPERAIVAMALALRTTFHGQGKVHLELIEQVGALELTSMIEAALKRMIGTLSRYLAGNPRLAVRDPDLAALVIVRAVEGVSRAWPDRGEALDEEALARETAAMILGYLPRRPS